MLGRTYIIAVDKLPVGGNGEVDVQIVMALLETLERAPDKELFDDLEWLLKEVYQGSGLLQRLYKEFPQFE